jgi:hypothetical protein
VTSRLPALVRQRFTQFAVARLPELARRTPGAPVGVAKDAGQVALNIRGWTAPGIA